MTDLKDAVAQFPILQWLGTKTKVYYEAGVENVYADCPFCKRSRKLGISRTKRIAHCFYCSANGHDKWAGKANLVSLVMLLEDLPFKKAADFIASYAGVELTPTKRSISHAELPNEMLPLLQAHHTHPAIKWLDKRGLLHMADRIGICVDGRYAGRVIIPIEYNGKLVGFEAKAYDGRTPKALYPDWFYTSDYIYTTDWRMQNPHALIITESIFDAETVGQIDVQAAGLFGSTLKDGQLNCLLELRKKGLTDLIWMLDWDAWRKQAKIILKKTAGLFRNHVANIPANQDPNSLGVQGCMQVYCGAMVVQDQLDLIQVGHTFGRPIDDLV